MGGPIASLRARRGGQRVTVRFADGSAVELAVILAAPLRIGQDLSGQALERLLSEDRLEQGFTRCLALLSRRPRSRAECERYLRRRRLSEEEAGRVIARLADRGLVDDGRFAQAWVENRQDLHPRSKRALRAELRRMGVADAAAEPVLGGVREEEAALAAARKKAGSLIGRSRAGRAWDWPEIQKKLMAHLAMRGFDYELSRDTVRRIREEHPEAGGHGSITDDPESEELT